jgi:hypothetical protein
MRIAMIQQNILNRVTRAHDAAVTAAQRWSEAAAKGRRTDKLFGTYEAAERRFEAAIAVLVDSQ